MPQIAGECLTFWTNAHFSSFPSHPPERAEHEPSFACLVIWPFGNLRGNKGARYAVVKTRVGYESSRKGEDREALNLGWELHIANSRLTDTAIPRMGVRATERMTYSAGRNPAVAKPTLQELS